MSGTQSAPTFAAPPHPQAVLRVLKTSRRAYQTSGGAAGADIPTIAGQPAANPMTVTGTVSVAPGCHMPTTVTVQYMQGGTAKGATTANVNQTTGAFSATIPGGSATERDVAAVAQPPPEVIKPVAVVVVDLARAAAARFAKKRPGPSGKFLQPLMLPDCLPCLRLVADLPVSTPFRRIGRACGQVLRFFQPFFGCGILLGSNFGPPVVFLKIFSPESLCLRFGLITPIGCASLLFVLIWHEPSVLSLGSLVRSGSGVCSTAVVPLIAQEAFCAR